MGGEGFSPTLGAEDCGKRGLQPYAVERNCGQPHGTSYIWGNLYKKVKDPSLVGALSGHKEGSKAFARYREIDDVEG